MRVTSTWFASELWPELWPEKWPEDAPAFRIRGKDALEVRDHTGETVLKLVQFPAPRPLLEISRHILGCYVPAALVEALSPIFEGSLIGTSLGHGLDIIRPETITGWLDRAKDCGQDWILAQQQRS